MGGVYFSVVSSTLVVRGIATGIFLTICTNGAFAAPVVIQQVENGEGTSAQYAPVNFNGSPSVTTGGITYWAMSGTANSTYSSHAATVASRLSSYAASYLTTVYNQEANNYLSDKGAAYYANIRGNTGTNGYGYVALPAVTQNGIKIVNHSWIADFSNYAANARVVRTLEYIAARDDLLVVAAAVTDVNASTNQSLAWTERNGLAVRGTLTFNPAVTTASTSTGHTLNSSDIQRKHADLWGPVSELTSFVTPQVSGIAAQVIGGATDAGMASATHHEVVKSILMTAANATPATGFFSSYTPSLPNNLDPANGAGRADAQKSYDVLSAGQKSFTSLSSLSSGSTITAPAVASSNLGWGYLSSISASQSTGMVFHTTQALSNLTASLAWDVTPVTQTISGNTYIDGGADELANLDLTLYHVNYAGGVYTLGAVVDPGNLAGLTSASTNDNVEHLYFTGTLPAGYYAFVATYQGTGVATDAGFSYQFASVPEPGALMGLAAGSLLLVRRRKSM